MRLIYLRKNLCWAKLALAITLAVLLSTPGFAGLYSAAGGSLSGTATASSYLDEMWLNPETEQEEQRVWAVDNLNDGDWTADATGTWIAANGDYDSWVNIALDSPAEISQVTFQTPFWNRYLSKTELSVKTVGETEYTPVLWWVNSTTAVNGISISPIDNVTDVKLSFSDIPQEYVAPIAISEVAIYAAPELVAIEVGGAMQSGATEGEVNLALTGVGIAQDSLTPDYAQDRLNDGQPYDAANAWIAASLDPSWAGVILNSAADIDRIALGNRTGYGSRSIGTYAIEYTTADMSLVDPTDAAAIDALTWLQIGDTMRSDDSILERQLLQFDTVEDVTAIRIKVDGEALEMALAEIEVYAAQNEQIPGDANKDGKVDGSDVTILAGNWQYGVVGGGATWDMGDFNGDGKVDGSDVTILAGNWQYGVTAAASAVPEPGTLCLLLGLVAGAFCFTHSRKGAKLMIKKIRPLSILMFAIVFFAGSIASADLVNRELFNDSNLYFYNATLNVAPAGTAYASEERTDGYFVDGINDGVLGNNPDHVWCSIDWSSGTYIPTPVEHLGKDYYFGVTLAAPTSINKVAWPIDPWNNGDRGTGFFELQYKTDGATEWSTLSQHVDSTNSCWIGYEFPTIENVTDVRVNVYGVPSTKPGIAVQELMIFEDTPTPAVQIVAQQDFADSADPNAVQDWSTNLAYWENGGISFASSVLNTSYSVPSLNDGYHAGEGNSFILSTAESTGDTPSGFCGIALPTASTIDRIAFGSQLGYNSRSVGNYTLQYTTDSLDSAADELAVMAGPISGITEQAIGEAGDAMDELNWNTITGFYYQESSSVLPRSVFQFDPLSDVTAIRVIMETGGLEMSIVELEVYAPEVIPTSAYTVNSVPEPSMMVMLGLLLAATGMLRFRRN